MYGIGPINSTIGLDNDCRINLQSRTDAFMECSMSTEDNNYIKNMQWTLYHNLHKGTGFAQNNFGDNKNNLDNTHSIEERRREL